MNYRKLGGTMKRALAGVLAAGMVLTGMPALAAPAASELPGEMQPGQETGTPENPVDEPEDTDSGESRPDEGDREPDETASGGEDTAPGEDRPGDSTDGPGEEAPGDGDDGSVEDQPGEGSDEPGVEDGDPADQQPDDGLGDENTPDDGQETEEPQPDAAEEETGSEEEPAEEEGSLNAVFNTQVSGNDISGNDLADYEEEAEEEQEGRRVVGGYIELPEDRDVSVVDESARIYDYGDEIAPLMSNVLPEKYIPEKGTLPLTRNQNPYGSCWAHSSMALAEIDMRKNEGAASDADYSELHLAYFSYNGAVDDPLGGLDGDANYCTGGTFMDRGGNLALSQYVLANWVGAADESLAPYPSGSTKLPEEELKALVSKETAFQDVAHLQNAFQVNLQENRTIAKQMIQKYGALGTAYYDANTYYNSTYRSYYCSAKTGTNHAVTIVGWDDAFSADQFGTKPEGDGAWLIRNSWQAGQDTDSIGRYTYFWMSYYDKSLASGYAFDFEDADNYHHNYQYDGSMHTAAYGWNASSMLTANVFTAKGYEGGERLEAVGVSFWKAQTPYEISIYQNLTDPANPESGTLIDEATTTGTCGCEGFYTIPLENPVSLAMDDTFSVVVRYGAPESEPGKTYWPYEKSHDDWYKCVASAKPGQSFYKLNNTWKDLGVEVNGNLRIKAYTIDENGGTGLPTRIVLGDGLEEGIELGAGDSLQASCTVLPRSAADRTVRWESDQPSVAAVDEKGLITGVSDGKATITVTCNADSSVTASFQVEVYSELRSIQITGGSLVTAGDTLTLQTVRSPSGVDASDVQWNSSDEKVMTVDAAGTVTGIAPGYAAITAGIGEIADTKEMTCEFPDFGYIASPSVEGMTLTWPGGPGVKQYQIYRAEGLAWSNPVLVTTVAADGSEEYSYLDETVEGGKQYAYRIDATVAYIKGDGTEEKTKSTEIYVWSMPEYRTYSITYHLNGGVNSDDNLPHYVSGEDRYLYSPAKPGYTFAGWYTDEELTQRIYRIDSGMTGDIVLYAGWEPTTYTISYRLDYGTNNPENRKSYTVEDETFVLLAPTKEGYGFAGWYTDSSLTEQISRITKGTTGNLTLYAKWIDISVITSIQVKPPTRTTYKTGEALDLSGGEVIFVSEAAEDAVPMNEEMVSGFDSAAAGICRVTVSFEDLTEDFETLIVAEPQVNAYCGQKLGEVELPENEYGVYSWKDEETTLEREGVFSAGVSFSPKDTKTFQRLDNLEARITVKNVPTEGTLENGELTMKSGSFTYTGTEQEPEITITVDGAVLKEGQDYEVTYQNNKNVGTAVVTAEGIGDYHGSLSRSFAITPAVIRIQAKDKIISVGDKIPAQVDYGYEVSGLLLGDRLIEEPVFQCDVTEAGTQKEGRYAITPSAADAGPNYTITYVKGQLTVRKKQYEYKVVFDVQGHGTAPGAYAVRAGSTIDAPGEPVEKGYVFKGWYKDAGCTQEWDFEADIVQSDITLYAKWMKKSTQPGSQFQLQEIEDIYYYTGKAWKPAVSVYDGDIMLKAGRDYTVKYFNNVNANAGGVWKKGSGQGADFNQSLPYVEITGKGNYSDGVKVNFDIHPAAIADQDGNPAEKIVLKYKDQFVAANKALKPFGSIKYGKSMKLNQDYTLALTAVDVRDASGKTEPSGKKYDNAAVPAGYEGKFRLTVTGTGNYEGSISRSVHVTDKNHLMKNARITLGKNQKNVEFTAEGVELTPSTENSENTFTVKLGTAILTPGTDYKVSYLDESNRRVGKATLVITGVGDYFGTKTAAFTVKGRAFTAGKVTVTGVEDAVYTGKAITRENAGLVYDAGGPDEKKLEYGRDYTVSYAKNINKGTATMTFTGSKEKGYSGSFKKTFKIAADDIENVKRGEGWNRIVVEYSKAGAKPVSEIVLTNAGGTKLQNGKDYTLSYKNNKLAAGASGDKAPTVIITGKGNYQGSFSIPFTIKAADLGSRIRSGEITVKTTAVAYQPNKSEEYVYRPAVKLMEGKTALRLGTDYTVDYLYNTQADYQAYIDRKAGSLASAPQAVIGAGTGGSYQIVSRPAPVPLTIYRNKLTKANLQVDIKSSECVYTGTQVTPQVVVRYKGENGEKVLAEGTDFTVSYGANVKSGKKAGSLTISGSGTLYGGDVTVKFEISRKKINY